MTENQYKKLNEITPDSKDWEARVIVMVKKPSKISSTSSKTKYQNLILADEWGNCVDAVIYGTDITIYEEIIFQDMTYVISNALIKIAHSTFKSAFAKRSAYSWTINKSTSVKEVERPAIVTNPYGGPFTNYEDFKLKSTISTILVVIRATPARKTRVGLITDFICIDKRFNEVIFSLWEDNITERTRSVLLKDNPIVVLINFLVYHYNGISLCPSTTSLVVTGMDNPTVMEMQKWRIENLDKIQEKEKISNGSSSIEELKFDNENLSISELLKAKENRKYIITVEARIEIITRTCMYVCCEKCFCKTSYEFGQSFMCENQRCQDFKFATRRYKLSTQLKDSTGEIEAMAFGRFGEVILHLNEDEFYKEFYQDWDKPKDDINSYLEGLMWKVTVLKKPYDSHGSIKMSYSIDDMTRLNEDVAQDDGLPPRKISISELKKLNSPGKYTITVEAKLEEVPPCFLYVCCETCYCRADVPFGKRFYCSTKECSGYKNSIRRYRFCVQVCDSDGEKLAVRLFGEFGTMILDKHVDEFHEQYFPNWDVPLNHINKRLQGIKWKIVVVKSAFKLDGFVVEQMQRYNNNYSVSEKEQIKQNISSNSLQQHLDCSDSIECSTHSQKDDLNSATFNTKDGEGKIISRIEGCQNPMEEPAKQISSSEREKQDMTKLADNTANTEDVQSKKRTKLSDFVPCTPSPKKLPGMVNVKIEAVEDAKRLAAAEARRNVVNHSTNDIVDVDLEYEGNNLEPKDTKTTHARRNKRKPGGA